MQCSEGSADCSTMKWLYTARPHTGKKGHQGRRPAAQLAKGDPIAPLDWDAHGKIALAEARHTGLKLFETAHEMADQGVEANRHGQSDPKEDRR